MDVQHALDCAHPINTAVVMDAIDQQHRLDDTVPEVLSDLAYSRHLTCQGATQHEHRQQPPDTAG